MRVLNLDILHRSVLISNWEPGRNVGLRFESVAVAADKGEERQTLWPPPVLLRLLSQASFTDDG